MGVERSFGWFPTRTDYVYRVLGTKIRARVVVEIWIINGNRELFFLSAIMFVKKYI